MYGSCLLEKEASMYPGTLRSPGGSSTAGVGTSGGSGSPLPASNFTAAPVYPHYMGYPHMSNMDPHGPSLGAWNSPYSPPREDWSTYPGPPSTMGTVPMNDMTSPAFGSPDYSTLGTTSGASNGGSLPDPVSESLVSINSGTSGATSPSRSRHSPYAWMRKTVQVTGE